MNGVAHYLFGLLITLGIIHLMNNNHEDETKDFSLTAPMIGLIIIVTFFSHMMVDALAHFTYHPSESDWSDPVYAGWHLTTYIAEAVFAIYFLKVDLRYAIGMLGSVGFDLWDWSIARPLDKFVGIELPGIHFLADLTQNTLFGSIMSLRNEQWALIVEVVVVIFLFVLWRIWHKKSQLAKNPRPSSIMQLVGLVLVFGSLRLLTLI